MDLLKMLAEILGLSQEVKFLEGDHTGHYIRTPYAYQPKIGRKYVPPLHVDLGQGLLQLIHEVQKNISTQND
jgi:UDP-glucose 4-epimerase